MTSPVLTIPIFILTFFSMCYTTATSQSNYKALIIDGENNHGVWPKTTMMIKDYLEQTGMMTVDIYRSRYMWQGPHYDASIGLEDITQLLTMYPINDGRAHQSVEEPLADEEFKPEFEKYDVVISNMGWKASAWPESTRQAFEKYMLNGGGLIIIHAASNAYGDWAAYNKMIGLGGWGGRDTDTGPYVYYNDKDQLVVDHREGPCGSHGPQQEILLTNRAPDHPIMKGLPLQWLHNKDELYDRLRGPADRMTVLATAYSDPEGNSPPWDKSVKGTGQHEPMMMTIEYGKGRVFHTALGHMDYSMESVGFIVTLQRAAEWVITGNVTQAVPADMSGKSVTSLRSWK